MNRCDIDRGADTTGMGVVAGAGAPATTRARGDTVVDLAVPGIGGGKYRQRSGDAVTQPGRQQGVGRVRSGTNEPAFTTHDGEQLAEPRDAHSGDGTGNDSQRPRS